MTTPTAPAMSALQQRLLADLPAAPLPSIGRDALIGLLREAGLTGRGGAGFPVWRKLAAVAAAPGIPVVVANGAEGEPESGKDRLLLTYRPQLVLDGLRLVATALGARSAHLYAPATVDVPTALLGAPAERRAAAADGRAADGRAAGLPVTRTIAPDTFVAGEESGGGPAAPGRPPAPPQTGGVTPGGVGGAAPTLVQNAETLAHIALIVRHGPDWFRGAGTANEPGTFLATVSGAVRAPGVVEAGYGVRLGDLVEAAGGPVGTPQAVLVGGYHGGWVPARPELPISRASLEPYGSSPGAGVVRVLPAGVCGLVETARIAGYLAGQVAGQCGPCVNGLPRLAGTLTALAHRRGGPGLPAEVHRLTALVTGRGACRHPDGTARLIRSSLAIFAADVDAHLAGHCLHVGVRR